MHFRFRYRQEGEHVHVRVYSGRTRNTTHGKNGDLVFREDEWTIFKALLYATDVGDTFEIVPEDEPLPA